MHSDVMTRLRAANPAQIDPDRGHEAVAQAALQRILDTSPAPPAIVDRRVRPRGLALVLAALVLGVGGVLAATDPMGWWSSNPTEAHYRVNAEVRVRTPAAQQIRCRADGAGQFGCTPERERCYQVGQSAPYCKLSGVGLPYMKIDAIAPPPPNSLLTRSGFLKATDTALAARTITDAHAAQFRADLARVPDSFFTELRLAFQYGTYGGAGVQTQTGKTRVPPLGQPVTLICTDAGRALSCQDLNGDADAPIGAGVYAAQPGPGWRTVRTRQATGGIPPGIHFTPAEYQVLIDLGRFSTTTSGSSTTKGQAKPVRVIHLKR
jgi:hypothetical protein